MVIKRSPGGQACRWRAINFEIHLWSSGKNADYIFGDRSASSMSKWRPAWTLTPEMIHFRTKSVTSTLSMLIDLLTTCSTMSCKSTQVKIASTDLWSQAMFTFSEMLAQLRWSSWKAVSVPTSVIGGLGAPERLAILFETRTGDEKDDKNSLQRFGVLHLLQREILEGSVAD